MGFISQENAHSKVAILRERKRVSCLPSKFLKSRTRELPLFPPRITLEARALYAVPPAPNNPTRSGPQLSVSINPILQGGTSRLFNTRIRSRRCSPPSPAATRRKCGRRREVIDRIPVCVCNNEERAREERDMKKDSKFEIIKQELCAQLQEVTVGRRPEMRERRDIGVYKH